MLLAEIATCRTVLCIQLSVLLQIPKTEWLSAPRVRCVYVKCAHGHTVDTVRFTRGNLGRDILGEVVGARCLLWLALAGLCCVAPVWEAIIGYASTPSAGNFGVASFGRQFERCAYLLLWQANISLNLVRVAYLLACLLAC